MKSFFSKILFVALVSVIGAALTGCNPEVQEKPFTVEYNKCGAGYISVMATVPRATEVYYHLSENPLPQIGPEMLKKAGKSTVFYVDGEQIISSGIDLTEETDYYLYMVGKVGSGYSKMYAFEFSTGTFDYSQLATVVATLPDGYKIHLKMPESVKAKPAGEEGSSAIRYSHANIMMYNLRRSVSDDYEFLLWNGGNCIREDKTLEFSDETNLGGVGYDANGDGKIDESDKGALWDYIAPGEPIVFIAGEYKYMAEPWYGLKGVEQEKKIAEVKKMWPTRVHKANWVKNGFFYPAGWEPGYYEPCVDSTAYWGLYPDSQLPEDKYEYYEEEAVEPVSRSIGILNNIDMSSPVDETWDGAFAKKVILSREPAKLNAKVGVKVSNIRSVDAKITFTPDKKIYRYVYMIMDDGSYNTLIDEYLSGHEEYMQWAVSSYFAMMEFGAVAVEPDPLKNPNTAAKRSIQLSEHFYDVASDTKYHVLVTGMGGEHVSAPQCFMHYTFSTPEKTKTEGPTIVVTPLEKESTPFEAVFNIKCTSVSNNKVVKCYYGANYYKDWILAVNGNQKYEDLGQSASFTEAEVNEINSAKGLTIRIPSIDGEKTRLVVVGYNDENISNGISKVPKANILQHESVADCVTPYFEVSDEVYLQGSDLLDNPVLDGEWTMTATVIVDSLTTELQTAKVMLKRSLVEGVDYPASMPADVYDIYEGAGWSDLEIEGYFNSFKNLAEDYNDKRLRGQNKLLLTGWFTNDSKGRLEHMSPWDMFSDKDISTVDVESVFSEFGPKLFLEVFKDKAGRDSLALTSDYYFASPACNWSVPFYLAARKDDKAGSTSFYHGDPTTGAFHAPLEFPVTLSDDKTTITIGAITDAEGGKWYPNMVGIDTKSSGSGYILEHPVISEITLTKGTGEQNPEPVLKSTVARKAMGRGVSPVAAMPVYVYKDKTPFLKCNEYEYVEGEVFTQEKLDAVTAKYRKMFMNMKR